MSEKDKQDTIAKGDDMATTSKLTEVPANRGDLEVTRDLAASLFSSRSPRRFAVRLWDQTEIPAEGEGKPQFTLVLNHPGALRRMFFPPGELSIGEAYLRGDFDIEGDIFAALGLAEGFTDLTAGEWIGITRKILSLPRSRAARPISQGRRAARLHGAPHTPERDRAAVTYHYDTGNDFFALFLGQWMTYSCAYFEDPELDLDAAQEAKLDYICRKLKLQPGERLLDIGCGWGGLVVYAAENYGVDATGITLSEPQASYGRVWINQVGLHDRARVEVVDYRDLLSFGPFDKVVSVGMFEHVGQANLPAYFHAAFRALRPGGLFLNHGIARQNAPEPSRWERTFLQRGQFGQRYVFPDGELVQIGEALSVAELTGFEVRDVESLREHYARTLRLWLRNLEFNYTDAIQITDERTYRTWRLFMAAATLGFEREHSNVYQALLSKSEPGSANPPSTRADLYRQ
jgi:cyclopropane-fatty-acyl-phospholipid synthase